MLCSGTQPISHTGTRLNVHGSGYSRFWTLLRRRRFRCLRMLRERTVLPNPPICLQRTASIGGSTIRAQRPQRAQRPHTTAKENDMPTMQTIEQLAIDTIRTLSIDAVNAANSGHPGLPMGAAPMAYALWGEHLNHNPG